MVILKFDRDIIKKGKKERGKKEKKRRKENVQEIKK